MNGPDHIVLALNPCGQHMSVQPNTLAATSTVILARPSHWQMLYV